MRLRVGYYPPLTLDVYENEYWPPIQRLVNGILEGKKTSSDLEVSRTVFKVCSVSNLGGRLYSSVFHMVEEHLLGRKRDLAGALAHSVSPLHFFFVFAESLSTFVACVARLSSVLQHLDAMFVKTTLNSTLEVELYQLFNELILVELRPSLILVFNNEDLSFTTIDPAILMKIIVTLHSMDPELSRLCPETFGRFVPLLFPCTDAVRDLATLHAAETARLGKEALLPSCSNVRDTGVPSCRNRRTYTMAESLEFTLIMGEDELGGDTSGPASMSSSGGGGGGNDDDGRSDVTTTEDCSAMAVTRSHNSSEKNTNSPPDLFPLYHNFKRPYELLT